MQRTKRAEYLRQYHHDHYTGIYGTWYAMKQRCGNPRNKQYKDYGGRGITYDERWEQFESFKEDMQEGYKKGLTIDRIDTNESYSKENCKWSTRQQQSENKRCNIVLEYASQKKTLIDWSKIMGIPYKTLRNRYYQGWGTERMLETPKLRF